MKAEEKVSISSAIVALRVGEAKTFPISSCLSVRTLACNLGVVSGRKYATRTDREAGIIEVTRKS